MCAHNGCDPFPGPYSPSSPDPCSRDHCHIYYVHQHGSVYRHRNALFVKPRTENPSAKREARIDNHAKNGGSVKTGSDVENVGRAESKGQEKSKGNVKSDNLAGAFCGDDRLTLIQLPFVPKPIEETTETKDNPAGPSRSTSEVVSERLQDILPHTIPAFFKEKLKNICKHCECKQEVLWSNLLRDEQHFDACFRYVNKDPTRAHKCFLKLYTLRVPFLSDLTVSFSMVYHIRAQGDAFVRAESDSSVLTDKNTGDNREHMFAFIYGLNGLQICNLVTGLVKRWQDIVDDHSDQSTGITPQLLVAALLSYYGSIISGRIHDVYVNVKICDSDLQTAMDLLKESPEPCRDQTIKIDKINDNLIDMNRQLTGTRSTMHYLADSADVLVNNITPFEKYVKARLDEWPNSKQLKKDLRKMDNCREQIRDHDKLVMVRKDMFQHRIDIEALQQHININVGMVSNVIATRDRRIQESIMTNTGRDGTKMKFMAILTAVFLPGTFVAVFLTTPMFNFLDDTKPLLTKRGIPLAIYWGVTCLGFILLLIILYLLHNPIFVCKVIDTLIPLESIKGSDFYKDCKQRDSDMKVEAKRKKDNEHGTKEQKEKPVDSNNGNGMEKEKNGFLSNKKTPEQKSPEANGVNGKSISSDVSLRGGSKLSARWFHQTPAALCDDCHV